MHAEHHKGGEVRKRETRLTIRTAQNRIEKSIRPWDHAEPAEIGSQIGRSRSGIRRPPATPLHGGIGSRIETWSRIETNRNLSTSNRVGGVGDLPLDLHQYMSRVPDAKNGLR